MQPARTPTESSLPAVLLASGPCPGTGSQRDLYAALIGAWEGEVVDHLPGGDRRASAEIHFARVLEGRAVQDVWIVPARAERTPTSPAEGNRYGTTLRRYDPLLDAWRVHWFNPVTGSEARLVGRREHGRIVHHGTDEDGSLLRWSFATLTPEAFHWRGERSRDGGATWQCETEYRARRRVSGAGP